MSYRTPCPVPGCLSFPTHRNRLDGTMATSPYCKHHTCHAFDPKDSSFCRKRVLLDHAYCAEHKKCSYAGGCPNTPDPPTFLTPNGVKPVVRPSPRHKFVCSDHACYVRSCNSAQDHDVPWCKEHAPLCFLGSCDQEAAPNSNYCKGHSCAARGCNDLVLETEGQDNTFCQRHIPSCALSGCQRRPLPGRNHCDLHACEMSGCSERALTNNASGLLLCRIHTCAIKGCGNLVARVGVFCPDHSCGVADCTHPAKHRGGYCATPGHGCSVPNCSLPGLGNGMCQEHMVASLREEAMEAARAEQAARKAEEEDAIRKARQQEAIRRAQEAASRRAQEDAARRADEAATRRAEEEAIRKSQEQAAEEALIQKLIAKMRIEEEGAKASKEAEATRQRVARERAAKEAEIAATLQRERAAADRREKERRESEEDEARLWRDFEEYRPSSSSSSSGSYYRPGTLRDHPYLNSPLYNYTPLSGQSSVPRRSPEEIQLQQEINLRRDRLLRSQEREREDFRFHYRDTDPRERERIFREADARHVDEIEDFERNAAIQLRALQNQQELRATGRPL